MSSVMPLYIVLHSSKTLEAVDEIEMKKQEDCVVEYKSIHPLKNF